MEHAHRARSQAAALRSTLGLLGHVPPSVGRCGRWRRPRQAQLLFQGIKAPGLKSNQSQVETARRLAADHASLRPEIESRRAPSNSRISSRRAPTNLVRGTRLVRHESFLVFFSISCCLPVDRKQGERSRARPRVQDAGQSRKWAVRHRAYVGTMRQRPKKTDRDAPVGLLTRCFRAPFVARAAKRLVR